MAEKWTRVEKGIRYREHPTRKHGVAPDKYFVLRFTVDGQKRQEPLGWASEGITLDKARIELSKLREAKRTGAGERTLSERRAKHEAERQAKEAAKLEAERTAMTVGQFWQERYWPAQDYKAKGSRVTEQGLWRLWIAPAMQDKPLAQLSAFDVERVKSAMLKAGRAAASVKYALAVVGQIWTLAVRDGFASGPCPAKLVTLPKKDNRRQRYLSAEESHLLLAELKKRTPTSHDMALCALDMGLRFGEIAGLTWQDVDLERKQILIRDPKARTNRVAFLTARTLRMLKKRKADATGQLVFPGRGGVLMDRISHVFRHVADELFNQGVNDPRQRVCFHTLRHTFASWLVEAGTSLYAVKELMGHADFDMTQRYSHLSPEGLRAAIGVLEQHATPVESAKVVHLRGAE
ncbi:Site-specific recombinase XerD [Humidesulfovibrio mexicanus]|uniref:Site-specific recombinase XerD n=1 Tax=Humidesulfovibrio mexicanus TaxID=147047 RepID=A0A238ZFL2_9BACT|nr:site-specific integrase [Humidesulfovibrio mexicanus]SNR81474.1 Site-specific recombinase XerD [Humidesulfovibrio mexicanus]